MELAMIQYLYLGRVGYEEGLRLQAEIAAWRYQKQVGNVLLLLEHPPVLTLGRNANRANVLASEELLARRGITLHEINRGGDVTYHGPGQLVGYPIFNLRSLRNAQHKRLGPVDFVRQVEEALILLCGGFGVRAGRISGLTGVWCGLNQIEPAQIGPDQVGFDQAEKNQPSMLPGRKIAAIGLHVSRGITTHGFAFNVTTDLSNFSLINPCGITDRAVTSLEMEIKRENQAPESKRQENLPNLETVAHQAARQFGLVFGEQVLAIENLAALRAQAQAKAAPAFPAEDTPLQIPSEVERLCGHAERPERA
jgi:lipoyl(octanoyl) transferase